MNQPLQTKTQRNHSSINMLRLAAFSLALILPFEGVFAFHRPSPGLSRRNPTVAYVGFPSSERSCEAVVVSATRLNYSDGAEYPDDSNRTGDVTVDQNQQGWWTRLSSQKNSEDDSKQEAVDSYLEFLERRYHRLYDDEPAEQSRKEPKFSAWKWLTQGSDDMEKTLSEQDGADQENALYVLGVAGLASKRLLQKHQLPLPEGSNHVPETVGSTTSFRSSVPNGVSDAVVSVPSSLFASRIVRRVSTQRKLLLRYQNRKLKCLAQFLIRTIRSGPGKVVSKVLELGGGKRTIALTSTIAATLIYFLVRPLVQAIVSGGANHA